MDELETAWYGICFERDFLKLKGEAFQDFFSSIMEKRYPSDFIRVRPWGKYGDRKNDGYLKSKKILFQVYAPNEMKAAAAIKKIDEDFKGALPHWDSYINEWTFVHNSHSGLGPDITKKLLDLENENKPKKLGHWGFEELREVVILLPIEKLTSLFGQVPTRNTFREINFEDIRNVLNVIAEKAPPKEIDLRPVPEDKIEANGLSSHVSTLLTAGMIRASLVQNYFEMHHDPEFGDKIAASFKSEYKQLKQENHTPDEIFMKLQEFAGGGIQRLSPKYEASVLAVLSHLFEECDIFENPRVA